MMTITACGGSGGGSEAQPTPKPKATCDTLAGNYTNDLVDGETLVINDDCTFTESYCGLDASYSIPDVDSGATTITIHGNNGGASCLSVSDHDCRVEFNGDQLGIACDNDTELFLFTIQ